MKKETWILLALLGFGIYKHLTSKPKTKVEELKGDDYYNKQFRKIYDSVNGDTSKAIPLAISLMRKDDSFRHYPDSFLQDIFADFVNRLREDPNLGL